MRCHSSFSNLRTRWIWLLNEEAVYIINSSLNRSHIMHFKSQGYCFILYWAMLTTEIKGGYSLRSFVVKLVLRARDTILVYYSLGYWDATKYLCWCCLYLCHKKRSWSLEFWRKTPNSLPMYKQKVSQTHRCLLLDILGQ